MVCSLYRTKGSEAIGKTKLHFSGVFWVLQLLRWQSSFWFWTLKSWCRIKNQAGNLARGRKLTRGQDWLYLFSKANIEELTSSLQDCGG